jgi:hypothetical protein
VIPALPPAAEAEWVRDQAGVPDEDPGPETTIEEGVNWLCRAQDHSATQDGGVARHFSLLSGWGASYPETTGYIIPTLLEVAQQRGDSVLRQRVRRMLDWLVSIQYPEGAFQGGHVRSEPRVPVTFNTGQILIGLAHGVRAFGDEYRPAMLRAANWLVATQDPDGAWRRHPSPYAMAGDRAYDTHVAWGLLEAAQTENDGCYVDAAVTNALWALAHQAPNGWFNHSCLTDPERALTHTIGYTLRGALEVYRHSKDLAFLIACRKTADGLLTALRPNGFLPGRLNRKWRGTVSWACLTGTAQIAICWLILYQLTGDSVYRGAAFAANRYVRRTVKVDGQPETRGAVKGSFPVSGEYGPYEFLNWACKFSVDANLMELAVRRHEEPNAC